MQKSYQWIKDCHYRVSAKAFIRNSEWRFALCREHTWKWDIPWGWIDHGEEIHDALKREIMEEMWLTVTKISLQPIYTYIAESSWIGSPKRPIWVLIFKVEVQDLNFTPSDECTEMKFVTAKEAQDLDLYYPNGKIMREIEKQEAYTFTKVSSICYNETEYKNCNLGWTCTDIC